MKDYYKILQVSPDAAPEVIQMAYKALAKKYHPDLNPDDTEQAQEQMKELNEAFEVLSDPEKRARYNAEQKSAESASASTASQTQADTSTQKPPKQEQPQRPSQEKETASSTQKAASSGASSSTSNVSSEPSKTSFGFMEILDILLCVVFLFFVGRFAIKFFKSIDSDTSSNVSTSQSVEDTTEQPQVDALNYTWEQFSDFGSTYSFSENPYYVDGISRYVDMVNTFYSGLSALKTSSSKQDVSQTTLEQAMKDAGVSHSLIKKLLDKQGVDILQDSDFYRMDEKSDTGLVASLFDSNRERAYLEVSSTAKDAISLDDAILFYFGDLKDNKPDGNGAIFSYSQATGLSFGYAGQFKEGKMSGKGITFSHYRFGYSLAEAGEYEKNQLNGSGTQYRYDDSTIIYQFYQDKFAEYSDTVLSAKSEEEETQLFEHILEKNPAVELFLTASSYDLNRTTIDFNEAVICPYIEYKGTFKYGKYDGKGKFYAPGGWLAYDGAWGNGKYNGKGTLYNDDGSERKKGDFKYEEISDDLTIGTLSYTLLASYNSFSLDELFATDANNVPSITPTADSETEQSAASSETSAELSSASVVVPQSASESCGQEILVKSSGYHAEIFLMTYRDGNWVQDYYTTAAIGENGITYNKTEGDHMTPAGTFPILFAFSTLPQNTKIPFIQITEDSVWVCDPDSTYYNTLQSKNNPSRDWSDNGGAEKMYVKFSKKSSTACICFGFNGDGRNQYSATTYDGGSALFLDGVGPNGDMYSGYGDIKIASDDMTQILALLDPALNPVITIQ